MIKGIQTMYTRQELVENTREVLYAHMKEDANSTFVPFHNPEFKGELKTFFEEIIEADPNSQYLEKIEYGKERCIGYLGILGRLEKDESKQAVIDFINRNKELIDVWKINKTSSSNVEQIAEFILSQPDLAEEFTQRNIDQETNQNITKEAVLKALKEETDLIDEYGEKMPDKDKLQMRPFYSNELDTLMLVKEGSIDKELPDLEELLNNEVDVYSILTIMRSKYIDDVSVRADLFEKIMQANNELEPEQMNSLMGDLSAAVAQGKFFDDVSEKWEDIKPEEREKKIEQIFSQHKI
ncbi:hypothetical protein KKA15_03405 [Patescibacteria group bacterium]|nr:hypothetical protein [Patescibacteria group bacterium]